MKLNVKTVLGTTFEIEAEPEALVAEIKRILEGTLGQNEYPADQLELICQGEFLKDDTTLASNNVAENCFIIAALSMEVSPMGTSCAVKTAAPVAATQSSALATPVTSVAKTALSQEPVAVSHMSPSSTQPPAATLTVTSVLRSSHCAGPTASSINLFQQAPVMHPQKETLKSSFDLKELAVVTKQCQERIFLSSTEDNCSGPSLNKGQLDSDKNISLEPGIFEDQIKKRDDLLTSSSDDEFNLHSDSDTSDSEFFSSVSSLPQPSPSIREQQRIQFALLLSKSRPKKELFSHPADVSLPPLPPLPPLEVANSSRWDSSSSSEGSNSSGYLIVDDLDEIDGVGVYGSGSPLAYSVGLATDAQEEELLLEAAVRVADDPEARQIILNYQEGELITEATPVEVIMNFLIVFLGKERDAPSCRVCMSDFTSKDRCVRLKCTHIFHMKCIVEWLLVKKTCPICRADISK